MGKKKTVTKLLQVPYAHISLCQSLFTGIHVPRAYDFSVSSWILKPRRLWEREWSTGQFSFHCSVKALPFYLLPWVNTIKIFNAQPTVKKKKLNIYGSVRVLNDVIFVNCFPFICQIYWINTNCGVSSFIPFLGNKLRQKQFASSVWSWHLS